MDVLIVGSGGREHALARRLIDSTSVASVTVVPGNPGIETESGCTCRGDSVSTATVRRIAAEVMPDLVVVGPAEPLFDGLADDLRSDGFAVVGAPASAASIGRSKTVAKEVMARYGIPTPEYRSCADPDTAIAAVDEFDTPVVVKADGLAAGTGVALCFSRESAEIAIDGVLRQRRFGPASERVVVERHIPGPTASLTALVDESGYLLLPTARDYTQIGEGGTGPNTIGMGAISPNTMITPDLLAVIVNRIVEPSVRAVADLIVEAPNGAPGGYRGAIHFVLQLAEDGPQLLGYKVRFGDPEAKAMLPLIEGDFGRLLLRLAQGRVQEGKTESRFGIAAGATCAVVAASTGYPGPFVSGHRIEDIAHSSENDYLFYNAVQRAPEDPSAFVTAGGRVLTVVAHADSLAHARRRAYGRLLQIDFKGIVFRRDIGGEPLIEEVIEEEEVFLPRFEKRGGVLPVVVQEVRSGDVLMVAYTNLDGLRVTRETGLATFWSTSRETLWTKGKTSGNTLAVEEIRVDCDQDALLFLVRLEGSGVCHTKDSAGTHRRRCFYRKLSPDGVLVFDE